MTAIRSKRGAVSMTVEGELKTDLYREMDELVSGIGRMCEHARANHHGARNLLRSFLEDLERHGYA